MKHFCTYFDSRYLVRALALYDSLVRFAGPFTLHALCLDDAAYDALIRAAHTNLRPLRLADLETSDPALLQAKSNRSLVEYYFTLTPALPLFVLNRTRDEGNPIDAVTYLDADLYLFADPQPVFAEFARGSVLIIEHRLPETHRELEKLGRFNVGWLSFRNDPAGRACLQWWRDRCLEWCYDRFEDGKFADQKYLDEWPKRFQGVVISQHKGANLAPWNLARYSLTWRDGRVLVDNQPLIFYHFHRLRIIRPWLFDPGLETYGAKADDVIARRIYGPYLRALRRLMKQDASGAMGNLRLTGARSSRDLIRLMIHGRTLLSAGPITAPIHAEPAVRPLLRASDHDPASTGDAPQSRLRESNLTNAAFRVPALFPSA